jgi:hypothetical protein
MSSPVVRARRLRAEVAGVRTSSARLRASSRVLRDHHEELQIDVEGTIARREQIRCDERIGTWPYWAPPGPDLWDVLVVLPKAA